MTRQPDERPAVVDRAVQVLAAFRPGDMLLPLAEIASRTGLPKSSTHRFVALLVKNRLMASDGNGNYRLGLRLWELGRRAIESRLPIGDIKPYAERIANEWSETSHVGVLDGNDVVYVVRIQGSQAVTVLTHVGQRIPAHATASGKAILAYSDPATLERFSDPLDVYTEKTPSNRRKLLGELASIRDQGYATNVSGWQDDLCGCAAPILDQSGVAVAAIGIAGPVYRLDESKLHEMGRYALSVAREVSRTLAIPPAIFE